MRAKCSTNLFLYQKHNGKLEMMATDPNAWKTKLNQTCNTDVFIVSCKSLGHLVSFCRTILKLYYRGTQIKTFCSFFNQSKHNSAIGHTIVRQCTKVRLSKNLSWRRSFICIMELFHLHSRQFQFSFDFWLFHVLLTFCFFDIQSSKFTSTSTFF